MDRRQFIRSSASIAAGLAMPSIGLAQDRRVLKFVPQSDLAVLDPIWTNANVTRNHGYMVFDTLIGIGPDLRPVPQMLDGWLVEDGGLRWLLTLRPGLVFHDGTRVLARDCVASIQRWAKRDAYGQALLARTNELSAPDDRTIEFRLKVPFPLLPNALGHASSMMCAIMPERLAKTDAFTQVTEMVGSGPFRFKPDERQSGARVVYERFAEYVPRPSGDLGWTGGPKVTNFDRVEWMVMPDPATAASALKAGEIDWWENPLHDLHQFLRSDRNIKVETLDKLGYMVVCRMNTTIKPFDNPAIRRAILSVIDQDDFMQALTGGDRSQYTTGVGVFPFGAPMASEAGLEFMKGKRDLAKAKKEIADAGYNGEKIVVLAASDQITVKIPGDLMVDVLQKLGMNVDYQVSDWGTVVQRRTNRDVPEKGGWNLFCSAWGALDHMDPATHVPLRGNASYAGWFVSERLEALRDKWFAAPDLATQKEICKEIQVVAMQEVPFMPLGQFVGATAYRNNISGILPGFVTFWNVKKS